MRKRFLLYLTGIFFSMILCRCGEQKSENKIATPATELKVDSTGKLVFDLEISKDTNHKIKAKKIQDLFDRFTKNRQFNGSVLVAEDGKIIYANAFGYADFETKKPLSVHSSFHLASVSKQFTAMAIMMLKEQGKLDYDDDIKTYIPDLPYEGITIRHLMTHTSGVPNILNYIPNYITFWDSCEIAANKDVAYMLRKHRPSLRFKPGSRFSYNNTGYVLLALIVENVSKKSFKDFVEKKIFKPLRMDDSKIFSMVKEPSFKERAYGYGVHRSFYSLDEDDIRNNMTGEKGVYSSVVDLYKWDQALYTGFLVSDTTLKEAFTKATLNNGKEIPYGFGWRKAKEHDQVVYHFGHWRGFNTCIIRFTEDKKLIVILNNTGNRKVKYIAKELTKILYSNTSGHPEL